jgi:hypothetical protein
MTSEPLPAPGKPGPAPDVPAAGVATALPSARRANPYVGPRPFREGELFFGREREVASLTNTMLASKVVLLHSPSGAGKTSLIQTSVAPAFAARDFQLGAVTNPEFAALRVKMPPPADVTVPNRYVFSLVTGLVGHLASRETILSMTIGDALTLFAGDRDSNGRQLLLIDQFEEILRIDPGDIDGQTEFFLQLGEALDDSRRWALLAMREDYMGGLDRFRRYMPGQLRTTFRLDLLGESAALRAVQQPSREAGIEFEDAAARIVVDALRQVHSAATGDPTATVASPYVEPVLLQVLCYNLFRKFSKDHGTDFTAITAEGVRQFLPFDKVLSKYYNSVIKHAVGKGNLADQRALRDWIEFELITRQGLRKQTRSRPRVTNPDAALSSLQDDHLIRDDPRPGGIWWELAHDMLAGPIREDNRDWKAGNLEVWQVAAEEWQRSGRDSSYLLRSRAYLATPPAHRRGNLTENEQAFLKESKSAYQAESRLNKYRAQRGIISGLFVLSLIVNVILIVLLLRAITRL